MAPGRIGVGIIGAGNWAGFHAAAYAKYTGLCRVVAFADVDGARAKSRAEAAGAEAGYSSIRELLARDDIQLVSICTPPFEHAPNALAALSTGKHVLCEKPLATSLEECDEMISTAQKAGLLLGGVLQNRMYLAGRRAKALIGSGAVGKLFLAVASGLWWRGPEYFAVPWRGTWKKEGGGTLLNHHSHLLDLLIHLAGDPAEVCAATNVAGRKMEVEDVAGLHKARIGLADGHFGIEALLRIGRLGLTLRSPCLYKPRLTRKSVKKRPTGRHPQPPALQHIIAYRGCRIRFIPRIPAG